VRPILRPGVRLLRRDRHTWQFGLDWPGASVVGDSEAIRAVLDCLDGFSDRDAVVDAAAARGVDRPACEQALAALMERGLVQDADVCRPPDVSEPTWAAWSLLAGAGADAAEIDRSRRSTTAAVQGDGLVADEIRRQLPRAHVSVCQPGSSADVVVLAADFEPARADADAALSADQPHLWACVRDSVGLVGPLVIPGATACLRCVDAARADVDPAWPTLLDAVTSLRPVVAAVDEALAASVAALAVQEVAVYASGRGPQTLNGLIELPYGFGPVQRVAVSQHPRCGCGWPTWQDTMGA
jgi:bacteriocin biosynthesis cyclodehydratase domain-containing protein